MVVAAFKNLCGRFSSGHRSVRRRKAGVETSCDALEVRRLLSGTNTAPVIDAQVGNHLCLEVIVTDETAYGPLELLVDVHGDGSIEYTEWVDAGMLKLYDLNGHIPVGDEATVEITAVEHSGPYNPDTLHAFASLWVVNTGDDSVDIDSVTTSPGLVTGTLTESPPDSTTELLYRPLGQSEWTSGGFVTDLFELPLPEANGELDFELTTVTYGYSGETYGTIVTVFDVPADSTGQGGSSSGGEEEDEFWSGY